MGLEGTAPESQMGGERETETKHRNDTEPNLNLVKVSLCLAKLSFYTKRSKGNNPYTEGQVGAVVIFLGDYKGRYDI